MAAQTVSRQALLWEAAQRLSALKERPLDLLIAAAALVVFAALPRIKSERKEAFQKEAG